MHEQRHVRAWQDPLGTIPHSSGETGEREAKRLQGCGHEDILLEAVATAPLRDELGLEAFQIEADRLTKQDVEILERDMRGVRKMDRHERSRGGLAAASISNAGKVRIEIETRRCRTLCWSCHRALRHAVFAAGHGEKNLAQKNAETANEREHGEHEDERTATPHRCDERNTLLANRKEAAWISSGRAAPRRISRRRTGRSRRD